MMISVSDNSTATQPQRITASEIVIVDRDGKPRIRMSVDDDGTAAVKFLDREERLHMALYLTERNSDDEDYLFESGSDNDSGLLVAGRQSGATIRLGISDDGFFGKRARLEITEGRASVKRRHRFPVLPPRSSD